MNPAWFIKARSLARDKIKGLKLDGAHVDKIGKTTLVFNKAEGSEATLYIYEQIGKDWWSGEGTTALDVIGQIGEAKRQGATALAVRLLSPGGDVFEGNGIHEALKRCGMKTTAYNDGLCASAATMVALGCERVVAAPTSTWMMHCAWSMAMGNATDMRAMSDLLEMLDGQLADTYAAKSGKTPAECLALMQAGSDGTWMNAEDCLKNGFADEIASEESGNDIEDDDDPAAAAIIRLMQQTNDRITAANKARLAAASARAQKDSGASPGSNKPSGPPAKAK